MKTEIRIIIADDHPIVRQGLRRSIESEPGLNVVAEAADGPSALLQIQEAQPDIAILDIDMPGMNGFDVAREIRRHRLPVELIFLTIYREEDLLNEAIDLGAKGYVLKDSAVTDIVAGIRTVASGGHYISPTLTTQLIRRINRAAPAAAKPSLHDLTETERLILKLVAEYKTSREIAEELHVSPRTVETHRAHICQKLELHGSHALMKFALANKSHLS